MSNVFLGSITYNGQMDYGTAKSIYQTATHGKHPMVQFIKTGSLLAANCNHLYCMALNMRDKHNLEWFALLHADIVPQPYWLDKMIEIANEENADLLSVVVPIKNDKGLSSTALTDNLDPYWPITRLTMRQVLDPEFPTTFDGPQAAKALGQLPGDLTIEHLPPCTLLANTGCMIVRLQKHWSDQLFFTIQDKIIQSEGSYQAAVIPEDWNFSMQVSKLGGKVMATTAIQCLHAGGDYWSNQETDGLPIDDKIKPKDLWINFKGNDIC